MKLNQAQEVFKKTEAEKEQLKTLKRNSNKLTKKVIGLEFLRTVI